MVVMAGIFQNKYLANHSALIPMSFNIITAWNSAMAQHSPPTSPDQFGDNPKGRIADILRRVKTIAIVGASNNPARPSYRVMLFLKARGYDVIAVNPGLDGGDIDGIPVVADLHAIDRPIDMVDVFRASSALPQIVEDAIRVKAKVLWTQLNVMHDDAALRAHNAGLEVVVNHCPKIELS